MKHEKFKLLFVDDIEDVEKDSKVQEFLNSGITPRSVSINHGPLRDSLFIGYQLPTIVDKEGNPTQYKLVFSMIDVDRAATTEEVERVLEQEAEKLNGVICQDVTVEDYGLSIVFLTTL